MGRDAYLGVFPSGEEHTCRLELATGVGCEAEWERPDVMPDEPLGEEESEELEPAGAPAG